MNGHCDFHTFEMAVDVCDICYGDLCRSCALPLKGRKDMVCKDCALRISGVRGSGKPEVRGDRRTVKSRRKEYAEVGEPEDFFQYFDADLPAGALTTELPPLPASKDDRERAAAGDLSSADIVEDSPAAEETGIRRLLGRLISSESDSVDGEHATIDDALEDSRTGEQAESAKDADAVSQLADIRRRVRSASSDADPSDDSMGESNEVIAASVAESVAESLDNEALVGTTDLPPDSSVAMPSPLLRGFPKDPTSDPTPAAADDSPLVPSTDAPLQAPPASPAQSRPADHHNLLDRDPFDPAPTGDGVAYDQERRRPLRTIPDHPGSLNEDGSGTDEGTPCRSDQQDHKEESSPPLRDPVSNLAGRNSSTPPGENPFLKRSRVVSEPDAVPDFSTDPFSDQQRTSPGSSPNEPAARQRTPAPVAQSLDAVAEHEPQPTTAARQPEGVTEPREPVATAAEPIPTPQPAQTTAAETAPTALHTAPPQPNPAPESPPDPQQRETIAPPAETQPPAATSVPDGGHPAGDRRADRHPLGAYTLADRHPLAAFADTGRSRQPAAPPANTEPPPSRHVASQQPPTTEPASITEPAPIDDVAPQPPPIDDVFPDETTALGHEPSAGQLRAYDDIPSIDDLLPPEPIERLEPTKLVELSDTAPDISATGRSEQPNLVAPTELSDLPELVEPTEPRETTKPAGLVEPPEFERSATGWDRSEQPAPTEPDDPIEAWERWDPTGSAESTEPTEPKPTDPPGPDEPLETREAWDPTGSAESTEPTEPKPTDPPDPTDSADATDDAESTESFELPEPTESWESWKPTDGVELTGASSPIEAAAVGDFLGYPEFGSPDSASGNGDPTPWTVNSDDSELDDETVGERADVDDRGAWIPPALRGMAADAQEAAQNLPRRRRG